MRVPLVILSLLVGLLALPATAAAAGACALTVAVSPGHQITVTGTGFAASADVDITQTWSGSSATAGGATGPKTTTSRVTSDAYGGFEFTVDAGPGRGGTYDFAATGNGCAAEAQAQAVETAGGISHGTTGGTTGGTSTTPPPTDTAPAGDHGSTPPVAPMLVVLLGGALMGLALALRRTGSSQA